MTQASGWDGLLEPGETILWQGQPVAGLKWRDMISGRLPIGIVFTVFSLVWMGIASSIVAGIEGPLFLVAVFPLAGLPFLAIGLYMLAGHVVWDALVRRGTWYTLTDRTAFVATDILGHRKLQSCPLAEMEGLELIDAVPGDVLFGTAVAAFPGRVAAVRRSKYRLVRSSTRRAGFRRIDDARRVWRLIREQRARMVAAARDAEGDRDT